MSDNTGDTTNLNVEQPIEALEQPDLVVATFPDETSARAAFNNLRDHQKAQDVLLADIAIVMRDADNTLHINEPDDMAAPEGAIYGGTIGAIIGMIAGPLGLVLGGALGAMLGGAAAQSSDADIEDDWLKELGESLPAGSGMVVAVVPGIHAVTVTDLLTSQGGKVMTRPVDSTTANEMGMLELDEENYPDIQEVDLPEDAK